MKELLDRMYLRYGNLAYVNPDPVMFVHSFEDPRDKEVAGFIASQFALGRVSSILSFLGRLFESFPSPFLDFLSGDGIGRWERKGPDYYRFYDKTDIKRFFHTIMRILAEYGSLEKLFLEGYRAENDVWKGLASLAAPFRAAGVKAVADPNGGSACKRLHLFLRWMVRKDSVDSGIWTEVSAADLQYPVDTHILSIAKNLGITARKQADAHTVREITGYFRRLLPHDPVRYDFCLARLGIHPGLNYNLLRDSETKQNEHNRSA